MRITIYKVDGSCTCSFDIENHMQTVLVEYHLSNSPQVLNSASWEWVVLFPSMALLIDNNHALIEILSFLVDSRPYAPGSCEGSSGGGSGCSETHYQSSEGNNCEI
jgi:hypothetical protein